MNISGNIFRAAKKLKADGGDEDYYKVKFITDDVGKNDSITASDDSGVMARMAYAELVVKIMNQI